MKKVIIVILIWLTVLSGCMIYLCLNHENEKEEESAAGLPIPACYVQNHVYFTRYDREEDEVHQVEMEFTDKLVVQAGEVDLLEFVFFRKVGHEFREIFR